MFQLIREHPGAIGDTIVVVSVLGSVLAAVGGAMIARVAMAVPLHKGLILGFIAVLAYYGVFRLAMQVVMM